MSFNAIVADKSHPVIVASEIKEHKLFSHTQGSVVSPD